MPDRLDEQVDIRVPEEKALRDFEHMMERKGLLRVLNAPHSDVLVGAEKRSMNHEMVEQLMMSAAIREEPRYEPSLDVLDAQLGLRMSTYEGLPELMSDGRHADNPMVRHDGVLD